nr:mimitin, mitochondrial isoform X1 [Ipomoea batatas]
MSRIWARLAGMLSNRRMVGVDKAGNRYFTRTEEIDGIMKEKRWVVFKGEHEPTSVPVEWICWLNGQRKNAPTPEEMAELEARRELVRLNVARLKEEEERLAKEGKIKVTSVGKLAAPDLKSFVRQFPDATEGIMFFYKSSPINLPLKFMEINLSLKRMVTTYGVFGCKEGIRGERNCNSMGEE